MAGKPNNKSGKAKQPAAKTKKTPGKSNVQGVNHPLYKPIIYLDDGQIPAELRDGKVGKSVNLVVTGKIISKGERSDENGTTTSMSIEVGKMQADKKGGK